MAQVPAEYLASITENASRLGTRIQETFSERTRDISFAGAGSLYMEAGEDKLKDIKKKLDSNSDRDKLDAMKRLIALISKGRNVSEYFAQVVKNVASHNLEIRKLVYIYLLRYAEQEPDLALLSINTFQKDLNDQNPLIRAMALRVLSGIRVPVIGNIVVLAIKKCAADISPYVRKVAALAIPKAYNLDNSHLPSLIEIVTSLFTRERSPVCIGSVCFAFESICPTRLDLIHQQYRQLCRVLVDTDEWGQVTLIDLLIRYARTMLPRPIEGEELDRDVKLLLTSSEPLFQSRNAAVVLGTTRVFYYIGTPASHSKAVSPLLRLLHISPGVERVVLTYILVMVQNNAALFSAHFSRLLVRSNDPVIVKRLKVQILLTISDVENHNAILREFIDYSDDQSDNVISDSVMAIGRLARLFPDVTTQCLAALNDMLQSRNGSVVSSAVLVLKQLVQAPAASASSSTPIISQLARRIDSITHPDARACVIWLVGQYSGTPDGIAEWAPDVLRKIAKTFAREDVLVKLQAVTLAAKLAVLNHSPERERLALLTRYVLSLARYDTNYDLRDRSRMLSGILAGVSSTLNGSSEDEESLRSQGGVILRREQVKMVLFEGKANVLDVSGNPELIPDKSASLGSLNTVTGRFDGQVKLPEWWEKGVETSLRDTGEEEVVKAPVATAISSVHSRNDSRTAVILTPTNAASPAGASKGPWQDLDKFYDSSSEEAENDAEEEEDSSNGVDEQEGSEEESISEPGTEDYGSEEGAESDASVSGAQRQRSRAPSPDSIGIARPKGTQ